MDYYPREHSLAVIISNGEHHLASKTCKWRALLIDITESNWIMMVGHHLSYKRWHMFFAWLIVPKSTLHGFAAFRGMFLRVDNKGDGSWMLWGDIYEAGLFWCCSITLGNFSYSVVDIFLWGWCLGQLCVPNWNTKRHWGNWSYCENPRTQASVSVGWAINWAL